MDKLNVNGRLIVDNFYKKFEAIYPFLNPALFYPNEIGGGEVDTKSTIANARARSIRQDLKGYTKTGESEIVISSNISIKKFQTEIKKHFKVECFINCRLPKKKILGMGKKEYEWVAIGNTKYCEMTLGEANKALEKDGAEKVTETRTKGNNLGNKFL
jgi:hypothetical protein